MSAVKVVVTDFIEPDLEWEAKEMARRGVEFQTHQLKFAPSSEVVAATRDADLVVVNMVPINTEVVSQWEKCRLVIRHGVGYDNVDLEGARPSRHPSLLHSRLLPGRGGGAGHRAAHGLRPEDRQQPPGAG